MTDHERDLELVTAAAVIPPPRRWTPQGIPQRPARSNGQLRLNYRQPGRDADPDLFTLNIDPPPEASGSALMQGLADHAAVVAPLSAIERGSAVGDEGPINEAFLSTPVVRLIAGAHYILRSAVLVPAGGLLYLNGATISDLTLILLGPGARILDQPADLRPRLHFGGGLIWRADGANELANLPAGQVGQPYHSLLQAAGGVPPYVWTITGTLPPGLHLDVPSSWQTPVTLARNTTTILPAAFTLTLTQQVPAGSRLLAALFYTNRAPTYNPGTFTDTAGNTWIPYEVTGLGSDAFQIWECHTEFPLPSGAVISLPADTIASTGSGNSGIADLTWIRGGVSPITGSRRMAGGSSSTTAIQQPPIGDPGQMVITWLKKLAATDSPAWTAGSGTQQLGPLTVAGGTFGVLLAGVNYPADEPASPAAAWTSGASYFMYSVQAMVGGVPAPGTGIVTIGETAIDGTPTTPGSYPVTLAVTSQEGLQDHAQMIIVIAPEPPAPVQPPSIVTFALPAGTVGQAYTAGLAVAGGVPPWTWGAIGLPAGLSLDPATGIITGTPAAAGTFPVTITVADASGAAAVATFDLDITPAPAPPPGP